MCVDRQLKCMHELGFDAHLHGRHCFHGRYAQRFYLEKTCNMNLLYVGHNQAQHTDCCSASLYSVLLSDAGCRALSRRHSQPHPSAAPKHFTHSGGSSASQSVPEGPHFELACSCTCSLAHACARLAASCRCCALPLHQHVMRDSVNVFLCPTLHSEVGNVEVIASHSVCKRHARHSTFTVEPAPGAGMYSHSQTSNSCVTCRWHAEIACPACPTASARACLLSHSWLMQVVSCTCSCACSPALSSRVNV